MLWVGGREGKEGGLGNRLTSSGKEGGGGVFRGIFGIFQEPLQSGSRHVLLPRALDRRKVNIMLCFSLVMLLVEDGAHCLAMIKLKVKSQHRW